MKRSTFSIAALIVLRSASMSADALFTDSTFNLADYDIKTYTAGEGSLAYSQSTTDGNPAPSLQVTNTVTGTSSYVLQQAYFLNKSFVYNPKTQGAFGLIAISADVNFSPSNPNVQNAWYESLVEQDGNLYISKIFPRNSGVWETTGNRFLQSDYSLVVNPFDNPIYADIHPNFQDGDPIELGFTIDWESSFPLLGEGSTDHFDNLTIDVTHSTATPEPSAFIMTGLGLTILIGWLAVGRKVRAAIRLTGIVKLSRNASIRRR